jgi:type VI secretion system secreted protein VgrG
MAPPITLKSPLPAADLLFASMTTTAGLSSLGQTELHLLSAKSDLKPEDLLGKPVTVTVQQRDDAKRYFNGFVSRFSAGVHRGRYFAYQATVQPWLWFLTRTSDCRIFQDQTVPEIVKKVFEDHGIAKFEFKTFRTYRKWVYCVQYRESDYNFVARLLEHEGIYWYFEHGDGEHKLVLVDSHSVHDAAPSCASLPYIEDGAETAPDTDCVFDWRFSREVRSGKVALTSYDFERPSTDLKAKAVKQRSYTMSDYEEFDFQGDYIQTSDGTQLADDWMDELQTPFELLHGSSNAQGIEVGRLLKLAKHPRADQNAQYLVTGLQISAQVDAYESGNAAGGFRCEFSAIPVAQQFRPPRRTPKPFVQGPQTALVVGPSGEEIFTDKYGRVKVQFRWDRLGKKDEKSSCWVRVSHPWAGKNFGVIHIPRMGQEVIVDFLEGDPDQPIITGRVYNAEQMPPWDLPANATQAGILTRSSKGGGYGNANAIRFEDKKGSEQLWIHAEKNQDIEVENDETHWVGHDRTKTIDHDETTHVKHDRTETVDNNETITIHGQRTEVVDKDETITIHQNRTETVDKEESITIHGGRTEKVDKNESITIDGGRTETVAKDESITINGGRTETVAKDESITINGGRTETVAKNETITINGGRTESVAKDESITISGGRTESVSKDESITISGGRTESVSKDEGITITGGRTVSVGKDDSLTVAKNLTISAGDSISITTGSASITMKKDGTITIQGKDITIEGSGKINAKASSDIVMKGSKILQN